MAFPVLTTVLGRADLGSSSASERCLVIATACEDPETHGLAGHSSWSAGLLAQLLTLSGRITTISARSVQRILQVAAIKTPSLRLLEAADRSQLRCQDAPGDRPLPQPSG